MARFNPEQVAIIQGEVQLTYGGLEERVEALARVLAGQRLKPGAHVALLFGNDYRYVEALLGVMRAGLVAVPLSDRFPDERNVYILEHSDSSALLCAGAAQELAERISGLVPGVRLLSLQQGGRLPCLWDAGKPAGELPEIAADSISMLTYTSGSTGTPKGVLLTHRGQVWNFRTVAKTLMLDEDDCAIVAAPLYHKNAGMTLKATLMTGGRLVILPKFDPGTYLQATDRYRGTFISGVPAMFYMMLRDPAIETGNFDAVRLIQCGSAAVSEQLIRALQVHFPNAFVGDGYGLTEGGPDVLFSPTWGIRRLGSTGLALPGISIRVETEDGRQAAVDEVGELLVKNPGVTVGYYKDPERTAARFTSDGYLRTGDLARVDHEGFVYLAGRVDDMINVGGEKVYPKEVEEVLLKHPAVHECVVVPVPHEIKGAAPVAVVVRRAETTGDELRQYALQNLPAYAHPRAVYFVDAMPLNPAGKVDRNRLREIALDLYRRDSQGR